MDPAKKFSIPEFENTGLEEISANVDTLRATFRSNRTKDIQYRLVQLRKLYWALVDYTPIIEEGLYKDMHKSPYEVHVSELDWAKNECMTFINNLEKWSKDEPVVGVPPQFWPMRHRIRNEPLGVVLIIGAYNYPYQTNVTALAGAIAAGNCVVLKPSEHAPYTAMVLRKIMSDYLDPECYVCINGGVPESQLLLDTKFDKIMFTGGNKTATIIAKKAAETLTPVLLELGGQNPAFVTKNAKIKLAARRILWAKCLNAGQVCLSQNYVLVERSVLSEFIGELNNQLRVFMPKGAKQSPDFARVINKMHFDRMKKMLDDSTGKTVLGGDVDESELYIGPTAVLVDDINDSMITEESFGPIFSIMAFDTLDQAIEIANQVDPTPLSLITFGTDEENDRVMRNVTSGGATANDNFFHASINAAPFGGVGSSGMGNYHGYYSLKAFSHQRSIARVPNWAEKMLRIRYMPYVPKELKRLQAMTHAKPNFDRDGRVIKGLSYWLGLVFGLGGKSASSAALRWGVLIALTAFLGLKKSSLGL